MPRRIDTSEETREILLAARKNFAFNAADEWFENLTGRMMYEAPTISLVNITFVDRPVTLALNSTQIEPQTSLDPIEIMTDCLVDGFTLVRLGPGWEYLTIEPFFTVKILELDGKGYIEFLRFEYVIQTPDGERWYRLDYKKQEIFDLNGKVVAEISWMVQWESVRRVGDFDRMRPLEPIEIPFIPFVAFPWKKQESFFKKIKLNLITTENASLRINGENRRHSERKLYVKAPDGAEVELNELGDKVNLLTEKGDAFYPDPHASAMAPMFREKKELIEAAENATGVIATEKIVALSGVSRYWAMKSLVDFAKEIRAIFTKGLIQIEDIFNTHGTGKTKLQITYQPIAMQVADLTTHYELLKEAVAEGDIDKSEKREAVRSSLSL